MTTIRFHSLRTIFLAALSALIACTAWAGEIVLSLEEPTANSTYTGVANVRGFAVGSAGISRVELYVDGAFSTNIPSGGRRADVGAQYPNFPNSANSGFSIAVNYSQLSAGQHTIRVQAIDNEGVSQNASATFNVVRFDNPFINDSSRISLNGATVSHDSNRSIFINNMTADGRTYDVRLDWRTAMQGYAITQITPTGGGQIPDFAGTYQFATSLASDTCSVSPSPTLNDTLRITQNGSQLSGNVGDVSFSGTVDGQGNFSLASPIEEGSTSDPNCRVRSNVGQQGNFINRNFTLAFNFTLVGTASGCSGQCAVTYQGTINKTSSATTASANPDNADSNLLESLRQGLLNSVNKRLNPLEAPR